MRLTTRIAALVVVLALSACGGSGRSAPPDDAPGTPLTAQETRAVFVGQPWKGSSGIFRFDPNGTYTYESAKTTTTWGPWRYTINQDGSITGATATYRFYRIGTAYRYHNSESGEFYLALPGVSD